MLLPTWGVPVHFASLARVIPPRYGTAMAAPSPTLPDALLRLWLLGELAMAGLYGWQGARLWPYPADWAAPPIPRAVSVVEGLYLFLFIPAAIVVAARWRPTRDRRLAVLALAYGGLAAAAFAAWSMADTLGQMRALFLADAAISLLGMTIARRALSLSA